MQASVRAATVAGVDAVPVEVQTDVAAGLPSFTIVGLGDAAVLEARDRVRSAIRASGFTFPNSRVVVNLAPALLRKHGSGFDLAIATGLLLATGQIHTSAVEGCAVVGELGLDGSVRPVAGLLAHALAARRDGLRLMGPADGAQRVAVSQDVEYLPLDRLASLRRGRPEAQRRAERRHVLVPHMSPDLSDVRGHDVAKRALEICAAGGHNVLMTGPPGSGKTLLARCLPGILPPLTERERLETALVHSVAGLDERPAISGVRPFRAPHHTCSTAGLAGGGSPPRPGEASLAHNGILFLDELPEFGPAALQALRQPLEDGYLTLVRAEGRVTYPARFALVAAMNPCPCGYQGDPKKRCQCTPDRVARYQARVGGPLLDRMDVWVRMDRVEPSDLLESRDRQTAGASCAARVLRARAFAADHERPTSSALSGASLLEACSLDDRARRQVETTAKGLALSGRGVTRLLRVARTIADLDSSDRVQTAHIAEAVTYRFQGAM